MEQVDGFEVVNLGNDDPVELNHLIELVEDEVGRDAEVSYDKSHPADLDATWADPADSAQRSEHCRGVHPTLRVGNSRHRRCLDEPGSPIRAAISKARSLLDWEPRVGLEEGVRRTVEWHREHRDLARSVDLGDV